MLSVASGHGEHSPSGPIWLGAGLCTALRGRSKLIGSGRGETAAAGPGKLQFSGLRGLNLVVETLGSGRVTAIAAGHAPARRAIFMMLQYPRHSAFYRRSGMSIHMG